MTLRKCASSCTAIKCPPLAKLISLFFRDQPRRASCARLSQCRRYGGCDGLPDAGLSEQGEISFASGGHFIAVHDEAHFRKVINQILAPARKKAPRHEKLV